MKTLKVMSIIGIVYFVLCFLGAAYCWSVGDYSSASGYVTWAVLYGLALSIVTLVQATKK